MRIGLIGTAYAGKSTVFQLLTGAEPAQPGKANVGVARVPDQRIDRLSALYQPKKTTYAAIEFVDTPGNLAADNGSSSVAALVSEMDALVQVVQAFHSADEDGAPMQQVEQVQGEIVLLDWSLLQTRIERLEKEAGRMQEKADELSLLKRCSAVLEQGFPLRSLAVTTEEDALLRGYHLLTRKPYLLVVNAAEEHQQTSYPQQERLEAWAEERGIPYLRVNGQLEYEIGQLESDEREAFMHELGISESGISRLARAVYEHLGLVSFYTVGEDEVRAWTIRSGTKAKDAGGKIHSDIARGFIRAEVTNCEELLAHGSVQQLRKNGLYRLEGKEYIVQPADVISFRFNV